MSTAAGKSWDRYCCSFGQKRVRPSCIFSLFRIIFSFSLVQRCMSHTLHSNRWNSSTLYSDPQTWHTSGCISHALACWARSAIDPQISHELTSSPSCRQIGRHRLKASKVDVLRPSNKSLLWPYLHCNHKSKTWYRGWQLSIDEKYRTEQVSMNSKSFYAGDLQCNVTYWNLT